MLHHSVAYSCGSQDVSKVEALPNLGPYDRLKEGSMLLCEKFFMVGINQPTTSPMMSAHLLM
jgi:hypothetical protein